MTHLPLTNLRQNAHGTFRRLCMLAQAMQRTGLSVRIVTTVAAGTSTATLADTARLIEQDLRSIWGVEATVRLAIQAAPSNQRWVVQQFLGLLSYSRTPSARALVSSELHAVLADEIAQRPQFVMAHRLPSMFALLRYRERLPPVYFDMDDVEHMVTARAIGKYRGLRQKSFTTLSLPALMLAERKAVRAASKTFVCSAKDARYLTSLYSAKDVGVLPNSVSIPAPDAMAGGFALLMVGAYAYGPNADGADFMVEQIFPRIRERLPQAELWLAGAGCEALKSFGKTPANVRFLGFVDDLAAVYRTARVVVCPIRYGGGTRVKLIEAAAYSKPIVTTVVGAEGLGMTHEVDALFADEPQAFADACVRLIGDDALCARLGANAWKLASSQFDRERIIERLCTDFSKAA